MFAIVNGLVSSGEVTVMHAHQILLRGNLIPDAECGLPPSMRDYHNAYIFDAHAQQIFDYYKSATTLNTWIAGRVFDLDKANLTYNLVTQHCGEYWLDVLELSFKITGAYVEEREAAGEHDPLDYRQHRFTSLTADLLIDRALNICKDELLRIMPTLGEGTRSMWKTEMLRKLVEPLCWMTRREYRGLMLEASTKPLERLMPEIQAGVYGTGFHYAAGRIYLLDNIEMLGQAPFQFDVAEWESPEDDSTYKVIVNVVVLTANCGWAELLKKATEDLIVLPYGVPVQLVEAGYLDLREYSNWWIGIARAAWEYIFGKNKGIFGTHAAFGLQSQDLQTWLKDIKDTSLFSGLPASEEFADLNARRDERERVIGILTGDHGDPSNSRKLIYQHLAFQRAHAETNPATKIARAKFHMRNVTLKHTRAMEQKQGRSTDERYFDYQTDAMQDLLWTKATIRQQEGEVIVDSDFDWLHARRRAKQRPTAIIIHEDVEGNIGVPQVPEVNEHGMPHSVLRWWCQLHPRHVKVAQKDAHGVISMYKV